MTVELELTSPAGARHVRALQIGERLVLGRGDDTDLQLHDLEASRRHLAVSITPDAVVVTDLGSGNGTLLDGVPLPPNEARVVSLPCTLNVGTHTVELRLPGTRSAASAPPARLQDEYEHVETLGSGAHGTVSVAVHRASGRRVAVKTFRAGALGATFRDRFRREGRIRLDSPYVAQVYDVREEGGVLFLIMELVPGESAEAILSRGPFTIRQAIRVALDVARGLVVAHSQGVVHRDLKPANIIVTPSGGAKIVDFGIAKLKGAVLTATGQGIGTLAYVAPEQAADAKRVAPSADFYSLGATLFHMIAGHPPFDPRDPDFMDSLFEAPPPKLHTLRPDCPRKVSRLVNRLLEKEPLDRGTNTKTHVRQLEKLLAALD